MPTTTKKQDRESGASGISSMDTGPGDSKRPTFVLACWLLALLAFCQLISVGTALTLRNKQQPATTEKRQVITPRNAIQPRSLEDILASVGNNPVPTSTAEQTAPPVRLAATANPSPALAEPLSPLANASSLPAIADPVVEKLVRESRTLQLDGDMMRAMLKLDEATRIDPEEPAVTYHKALLFEEMGLLIKAADHYQQVQQMGIKAGFYFKLAANKLTKGMDVAHARRPILSIGPMNTRKGSGPLAAKHADVTITILARPDKPVNPADVSVQAHFYDKVNGGEIKKATSIAQFERSWVNTQPDWKGPGNEETIRISYTIPEADLADQYLLGERQFYGYVVELLYKGEIIDQQAQPRRLHSVHSRLNAANPGLGGPLPWLPDDSNSLLPGKDEPGYLDDLPPLPLPRR